MYSVVLATMLSAGAAAPDWGCRGCHGCWGCHGCHGCAGCWGCHGCRGWGCHGCRGCYGCYGCSCYGCYGCSCYGCYGCSGCYGCYGCSCFGGYRYSGYGYGYASPGMIIAQHSVPKSVVVAQTPPASSTNDVARITVRLPADAKLFVDNAECPLTSAVRTFATPKLEQGKKYYYTLRA